MVPITNEPKIPPIHQIQYPYNFPHLIPPTKSNILGFYSNMNNRVKHDLLISPIIDRV